MAKRADPEKKEFKKITEALREGYEELLEGAESESGLSAFWIDQDGEKVYVRCSDGSCGSISSAELWEIKNQIGRGCFVCAGPLRPIFNSEFKLVLYLICDRCGAAHRVVGSELCLTDK